MSQPAENLSPEERSSQGFAEAERRIEKAKREKSRELDLSKLRLTRLPELLGQLTALQSLNLDYNRLTTLPESLGQLTALQMLYLSDSNLTVLPESLGQLTALQELSLNRNRLTTLPESLGQLTALQELDLDRNRLTTLPEALGQLTKLRTLYLTGNHLTTLPESLGQLTALQELFLGNNRLMMLPESLGQLTALHMLTLGNNCLTTLPESLGQLTQLERLFLHNNFGLGLPEEVLGPEAYEVIGETKAKPPAEILEYYFRIKPASKPVLEARIIVIGDGAAGKTSLVRQLLHGLTARESETGTRDVVIEDWPELELENPRTNIKLPVSVHLWDFGGQNQMHAAHPYFFTTRTLYLVVAEARKDQQDRVDYWLKMVAKYGDKARALVVVNKVEPEGHAMSLDRPKLLDRYRNNLPADASAAFFATSCKHGTGVTKLRKAILRELEGTEQIWAKWPVEWFQVKESIMDLRRPKNKKTGFMKALTEWFDQSSRNRGDGMETLNDDDWREICARCGMKTEKDRDNLLEYLGHLGLVVCFPQVPRLRALGVLNPDWVTRGIYPLLVDTKIGAKGGMVDMKDLEEILPCDRYPKEKHPWLVDLMKAFELVFEDSQNRLLLPGQLPADSPPWAQPAKWEDVGTLHLELRYDAVLPESVISQFIVRRHKEARNPGEWWRHGIALKRGACEALIRAHVSEQEAKIELRLRGPRQERRDYLSSIRETLRDPKDSTPPVLHIILGKGSDPKYNELLILATVTSTHPVIIEGKVKTIQLAEILDMIENPDEQAASRQAAVNVEVKIDNRPDMSNKNYNMTNSPGAAQGEHIQQTFTNCYNTLNQVSDENVKEALKALVKAVEVLHPQLQDADTKKIVERKLKLLTDEAVQPKPDKEQIQLSGKGLIDAAKTCAKMAAPVITATKAVLGLFGVTVP